MLNCNEKVVNLTNCLKNITMNDVEFWAADARYAVNLCFKKALCPPLDIRYTEDTIQKVVSEDENSPLEKFL